MGGPLNGTRIIDLSWAGIGPSATSRLAFFGAEVIKIESAHHPDLLRTVSRMFGGATTHHNRLQDPDAGVNFTEVNIGKKGATIDFWTPKGAELVRRLVRTADAVVCAMRPGVLEGLGLGWDRLSAANPRLVLVTASASGNRGPEKNLAGYASIFAAMGGVGNSTGYATGPPAEIRSGADMRGGLVVSTAVMLGIAQARRTGIGRWLDVSANEALLSFCPEPLLEYQAIGFSWLHGMPALDGDSLLTSWPPRRRRGAVIRHGNGVGPA